MARIERRDSVELVALFDAQITTLKERGCPGNIVAILEEHRKRVLELASGAEVDSEHIPFLPVIPKRYSTIYDQMRRVILDTKPGYTFLNPDKLSDLCTTPREPYYIFDVENGMGTRNLKPAEAEPVIAHAGRLCLTAVEVIALGTHTDIVRHLHVFALASRHHSKGRIPHIFYDVTCAGLGWNYQYMQHPDAGTASCKFRETNS